MSWRRYRTYKRDEFIVVFADTSWGGKDYCAVQFLSKTSLDVPTVYHSRVLATEMTPLIHLELERIYQITGVQPVVAFERNNGGVAEMERLAALNRQGKYRIYVEKTNVGTTLQVDQSVKLGYTTTSASRPTMLSQLKEAIDNRLIRIYDKPTINEMFSFIISQTSSSWKAQAESGAHDDCFIAGSLVTTDNGQVPIERLRVGDMVLTTEGYRPIIHTRSRYDKVITKYGLTGTPTHPFITDGGNVCFDKLKGSDIIYIWNEKQSTITARTITDTLNQSVDSIESTTGDTTSGRKRPLPFIGRYGLIARGRYQKVTTSTIKTETPLTTILETLNSLHLATTKNITWQTQNDSSCILKSARAKQKELLETLSIGDKTIQTKLEKFTDGTDSSRQIELQDSSRSGARIMLIKCDESTKLTAITKQNVSRKTSKSGEKTTQIKHQISQEKTLWLIYTENPERKIVKTVKRLLHTPVNLVRNTALKLVGQKQGVKQKVYNIQVADTPEYFVNNILVHNCIMSLAGVWQLYQTENPITKPVRTRPKPKRVRFHV